MTIKQQQEQFNSLQSGFEKKAFRLFHKEFRDLIKKVPFDRMTYENAEYLVLLNVNEENLTEIMKKVYLTIGLQYGRIVYNSLPKDKEEKKALSPFKLFSEAFQTYIRRYFVISGKKIVTLNKTLAKTVMIEVSRLKNRGIPTENLATEIKKIVDKPDFYRWQALRIARTETGFAMNGAKEQVFKSSNLQIDKIWIRGHAKEPRTTHTLLNGRKADSDGYFTLINGIRMLHPHDQNAPASEVINCTCTFGYEPKRDSNGRLTFNI